MTEEIQPLVPTERAEIQAVAQEMAAASKRRIQYYIREMKLPVTDAFNYATKLTNMEVWIEQVKTTPAQQVTWGELNDVAAVEEQAAWQKWEQIKAETLEHLRTGQFAADALKQEHPWERAQFLMIRKELMRDWKPRNGMEQCLIDQMAMCYMRFLEWQRALTNWAGFTDFSRDPNPLPRITTAEAIECSAAMIDRFNRLFLRNLQALRDLLRYNTPVIVQNAGQVNVAANGGQQINVAQTP